LELQASLEDRQSIEDYLRDQGRLFDLQLAELLGKPESSLQRAMHYSLFLPAKRLRPLFCLELCRALTGSADRAFWPAAALELIHTYSLVHDDLPAMDDDDLRRGQPTSHRVFGEAQAILAGDALLTKAFEILARPGIAEPLTQQRWIYELALASGDQGMVLGQDWDLSGETIEVQDLHRKKTGALFAASWTMGAMAADQSEEKIEAYRKLAFDLGLAFQIQDDVLDVEGGQEIGKPVGSDAKNQKKTFVTELGLTEAKEASKTLLKGVLKELGSLSHPYPNRLAEMAQFVIERKT
jgi:geranylgeranyl pyrophosphate synthase